MRSNSGSLVFTQSTPTNTTARKRSATLKALPPNFLAVANNSFIVPHIFTTSAGESSALPVYPCGGQNQREV